jgi:hypothetical protein
MSQGRTRQLSWGALASLMLAAAPLQAHDDGRGAEVLDSLPSAAPLVPVISSSLNPLVVPTFHSFPSAPARIYLDFDGDVTPNWGTYTPGVTPAYDVDGDATTFSDQELAKW